jgi:sugar/nucleoside kinase (ribokinase family)
MDEWLPRLDYLFVNADEALSMTGCRSVEEAAAALMEKTPRPLVKMGKAGALFPDQDRVQEQPGLAVEVTDTTGAGDAFAAGVLFVRLEKGYELADAVKYGVTAGARSCMFPGGVNARSSFEEVLQFSN